MRLIYINSLRTNVCLLRRMQLSHCPVWVVHQSVAQGCWRRARAFKFLVRTFGGVRTQHERRLTPVEQNAGERLHDHRTTNKIDTNEKSHHTTSKRSLALSSRLQISLACFNSSEYLPTFGLLPRTLRMHPRAEMSGCHRMHQGMRRRAWRMATKGAGEIRACAISRRSKPLQVWLLRSHYRRHG